MLSFDRFERSLPALLDDLAAPRLPDYADDLFARTAATRQRPGWTFSERWLPMSAITRRFAVAPRVPWRLGALVALLAVAALVAALVAGSFLDPKPAPYGPANNGQIVFVDDAGRIAVGDPTTETSRIVADVTGGTSPLFSQDGTRIAFLTNVATGRVNLGVVNADGTNPMTLNAEPIVEPSYVGWSPDGARILVLERTKRLLVYDTRQPEEPFVLSGKVEGRIWSVGHGYNFRSTSAFRPPTGNEILFVSGAGEDELVATSLDGSTQRTIFDRSSADVEYLAIIGSDWSPDGSQIVMMLETSPDILQPFILNADGSNVRSLSSKLFADPGAGINSPLWSPDGTRVAFQLWLRHPTGDGQEFNPIIITDVATGEYHDVGPTLYNGASWHWSPDGTSILEVPADGSREILIIDAETGTWSTAPWLVEQPIDWQRVAP